MIVFNQGCLERIAKAAERAYPEECCGLLIGRRGTVVCVTGVAESDNVAPRQRSRRFEIDPALRFSLMRRLRGGCDEAGGDEAGGDELGGDEIIGHYHSHPEGSATPSAHDASRVFEPDLLWLIVAVAAGRAREMGCWRWDPLAARFCRRAHCRREAGATDPVECG